MPQIKNAIIRFRIIDRCLRNKYKPFPTKSDLRTACEEALYGSEDGANICDSTIEKDMFAMKMEHDAPIKYSKRDGGYYYADEDFSINDIPLSEDEIDAIKFATNTLIHLFLADYTASRSCHFPSPIVYSSSSDYLLLQNNHPIEQLYYLKILWNHHSFAVP